MPISVRTRFEGFKRDRFTCSYCGRTPPTVLLEVDHVLPRAAGGSDDIENLTTACQDCNRGKSANLLDEGSAPTVTHQVLEELQERIDQATAYAELMQIARGLDANQLQKVIDAWAVAFGALTEERESGTFWVFTDGGSFPRRPSIGQILRRLPLHEVLEAIEITAAWTDYGNERAARYFYGVCWRRIRKREGER